MKRSLVLLAAGLALVLGACAAPAAGPPTPPAEVTPASTEAPAPAEPPIPDWMADQPVPEFLDAEQQDLFRRAFAAANFLMGPVKASVEDFPLEDGSMPELGEYETVGLDGGWIYLVAQGRYARWADFQAMLDGLEYGWADVPDTYELVSQSEDAVEFYLVGHYADLTVQPDETGTRPLSTERWPIRMERTADGWRVSEFHVPY